ncbi:polyprenyl synthetase family protein [Aliikangiella coralliicola]|uniref:Octaprenyl diphosphate synthase n=1 Tax=Aliikangiella coralliicola TaxID=2592383 RepID=A0A545UAF3_9GAMM|nr:polyprenyl synthetase family protein [Aliikangiella coralliicola]TQV86439.1 octaprenyl diphosphate synthase [Aliikangiella coralliicola]
MADIKSITALIKDDFQATNQVILEQLQSDVVLVNQLGHYIVSAGGKRLRPLLVLMVANCLGYKGNQHQISAAIIEFIHTATLLHDDVVDESDRRRGRDTANALFGNAASVLVGDFLYSRSFQMMVGLDNMQVMEILSNTTNQIAEGEVLQLMNCNDPDATEASYFKVINNKTAILFAAACQLGAVISDRKDLAGAMHRFGLHLGLAFQLQDDALDYVADSEKLGKNVGDDLAEGKPTLPLIYARDNCPDNASRTLIKSCIENGGLEHLTEIQKLIKETGAIEYTLEKAHQEVAMAKSQLEQMPENEYLTALYDLAELAVKRTS